MKKVYSVVLLVVGSSIFSSLFEDPHCLGDFTGVIAWTLAVAIGGLSWSLFRN